MKKWHRYYGGILGIIFVMVILTAIILEYGKFPIEITRIIIYVFLALFLLMLLVIIIYMVICGIIIMKKGMHNIRTFDEEPFNSIDEYKKCSEEDKQYYITQIQIINLYYQKNGKIDELINNKEIKKLYARADFLSVQHSLFDYFITCACSLSISVIASFLCQMMDEEHGILTFLGVVAILLSFFLIVLLRYVEKGQAGSYRYLVDEYEKELLLQKITELEQQLTITVEDEKMLETKKIVINELLRQKKGAKVKKEKKYIENDIHQIRQLDLCLGDYTNYYIKTIYVNKSECYLVYHKEKENSTNAQNLANQEYVTLYQILNKYKLISQKR